MKTIVLLGINARYSHSNPALYYLREYCRDTDYRIIIREVSVKKDVPGLLEELRDLAPDILGISVYIWNSLRVKELLRRVREFIPRTLIVLGGPETSFNADDWCKEFEEINYIVTGHGEEGFRLLMESDFRLADRIVSVSGPPFREIPFPYRDEDFPRFQNRYVYYEASRGCPYRCSYCLSSRRDQALDFRDPDTVKKELRILMDKDLRTIKFVDRTFNADRGFARDIWRYLLDHPSRSRFHFEIFPHLLEEEDFALLSRVPPGYFQFEIGIQSTNPETLAEINRPGRWDNAGRMIHRLAGMGNIHIHLDLIAGLPCEDYKSFMQSFNRVYALGAHYLQLGFLKILPGTEMAERKIEYGILHRTEPPYTVLSNKWISREELAELKGVEYVLNFLYNSGKYYHTLSALNEAFSGPFELYHQLTAFLDYRNRKRTPRDWITGMRALIDCTESCAPGMRDEILHCLRKDWSHCMKGKFPLD